MRTIWNSIAITFKKFRSELKRYQFLLWAPLLLSCVLLICVNAVTLDQLNKSGEDSVYRFRAEAHGIVRELQIVSDALVADGSLQEIVSDSQAPADPLLVPHIIRKHLTKNTFVSDVYLISEKHGYIYSQDAIYAYDALSTILGDFTGESIESLSNPDTFGWHILNADYTSPYYLAEFPDGEAILLVTLNKTEFIRTFFNNGTLVCCMFNDSFSISNQIFNSPDTDWHKEADVSAIAGERVKCFYLEQDGYTYMTALSRSEYNAPVRIILAVFCVYFLLVLILGTVYILRISQKRYNDVVAMIGDLPHPVNQDTSYEELVAAMRKSLEDFKQHYNNQQRFQRRNQLISFLTGTRTSYSQEVFDSVGFKKSEYGYYVAIIHFVDGMGVAPNSPPPENIDITSTVIYSALSKAAQGYMDIAITHLDRNYVAVISVLSPLMTKEDVRYLLDETVLAAESEYGCGILALSSNAVSQPEEIAAAYKAACSLYSFAHSAGSDVSVLIQSDMEKNAGKMLNGDFAKQLQLISATMQLEKYDMVPQMVETILKEHVANLGNHYSLARSRISAIANVLVEAVAGSTLSKKEISHLVNALQKTDSISQMNRLAGEICDALKTLACESESVDLVTMACAFIEENLSNASLSVPDVSEAMGVSVQHLSRLFRKKMNITVVEHINTARIEKAKTLIVQKGMTVNKVAEAVGYSNNVTFSRNFKRYVGMSPSEYREISNY